MSVMRCDRCDRYVDTDYCVEGEFTDDLGYICAICIENAETEAVQGREGAPRKGD